MGRVLLESAACGLAIIATDVGGTREIFPADSQAAILVPPDDPDAIAKAVLQLLGDEQRRTALGAPHAPSTRVAEDSSPFRYLA